MRKLILLVAVLLSLSFSFGAAAKGEVTMLDHDDQRLICEKCDGDYDTWITKYGWDYDPISAIHQDANWAVVHTLGYPACYTGSFYKINKTDGVHEVEPISSGVQDCAEVAEMRVTTDSKGRTWLETWDLNDNHYKVQVK